MKVSDGQRKILVDLVSHLKDLEVAEWFCRFLNNVERPRKTLVVDKRPWRILNVIKGWGRWPMV